MAKQLPEIRILDENENSRTETFNRNLLAQSYWFWQQVFWLAMEKDSHTTRIHPEESVVQISHTGVDILSKNGDIKLFMGTRAYQERIMGGLFHLMDEMFITLGGEGVPVETDKQGNRLPPDIGTILTELRRLASKYQDGEA